MGSGGLSQVEAERRFNQFGPKLFVSPQKINFLGIAKEEVTESLYVLGPFSNKVIDAWAVLAFSFLLVSISVPSIGSALKLSTLTASQLGLILIFAFLAIIWREIAKVLMFRPNVKGQSNGAKNHGTS